MKTEIIHLKVPNTETRKKHSEMSVISFIIELTTIIQTFRIIFIYGFIIIIISKKKNI